MKLLIAFTLLLFKLNFAMAADASARWIDLEWDDVQGAAAYEVSLSEIIESEETPRGIFSTDTAHWSKEVNPGNYNVRIRALDKRKVPGAWGEPIPVTIKQEDPQQLVPLDNEEILKNETGKTSITFQWGKVYGAQEYMIRVFDQKGEEILSKKTTETEIILEFSDISDYYWIVTTGFGAPAKSIALSNLKRKFSIRGEKLKSPIIEVDLKHPKGIVLKWAEIYRANDYEVSLSRMSDNKNELTKKAVTQKPMYGIGSNLIPQGKWLFTVVARSKQYKNSDVSRIIFSTDGKKTEIVTNESVFKETNYRDINAPLVAMKISYPTLNYTNKNYEKDTSNDQTLRGIQFSINHSLPLADTYNLNSQLTLGQFADSYVDVTNYNLSSGVRKIWGSNHLKLQTGLSLGVRSNPLLSSNRLLTTAVTATDFMVLYPELNFQLNYKATDHFEIEILAKADMNFKNLKSSTSGEVDKSLNKTLGFRVIYNINSKFNFSVGFNSIDVSNRTLAKTGSGSYALSGDVNETKINANFVDFGVEYFY